MKKNRLVLLVLLLPFLLSSLQQGSDKVLKETAALKSAGPPACYAGEPTASMTCRTSGCHFDFPLNSGTALLSIDIIGAQNGYIPANTYTVNVSLTKPGLLRGGFQLIALQDNDHTVSPGVFTLTNTWRTQIIDINNPHLQPGCEILDKKWIEHTDNGIDDVANNTISWNFNWQAPANDVGSITFYVASVEANQDLDETGDYVYTKSKTLSSPTSVNTSAINQTSQSFYPNPVSDVLYLDYADNTVSANNEIVINGTSGNIVMKTALTHNLITKDLLPGVYFATVKTGRTLERFTFIKL